MDFVTLTQQVYKTSVLFLTAVAINPTVFSYVRSDVLAVVLLKFKDFWDVIQHHCASCSGCFKRAFGLHVRGEAVLEDLCMTLQSYKTKVTTCPMTQCHIPEGLNL